MQHHSFFSSNLHTILYAFWLGKSMSIYPKQFKNVKFLVQNGELSSADWWNLQICKLLTNNLVIFFVEFGINEHSQIFQRLQIALAPGALVIWPFEKFTCAHLFQIALKIIWYLY